MPENTTRDKSTLMKTRTMPTVHCDSSCSPSHLILSMDSLDNPNNPGLTTNQLPSIMDQDTWASIPIQCSGLVPALDGHPGIHPACDDTKTHLQFPSNPDPVSSYSNYSTLFISSNPTLPTLVHTLVSFALPSPYPPTLGYDF